MRVFNIEIFKKNFTYRGSAQLSDIKYKFDYTDIGKNTVDIDVKAEIGDYITIKSGKINIFGIVSGITHNGELWSITYKPWNSILDVSVFAEFDSTESAEECLARLVSETYVENTDTLQNIAGLSISCSTSTSMSIIYEDGAHNLMNIAQDIFTAYEIVCDFKVDVANQTITLTIGKPDISEFHIESNTPNILEKNIVIQQAKDTVNKLIVYNQEDLTEKAIYYRQSDDTISTNPTSRVLPVNQTTKGVKVSSNKTFDECAMSAAISTLKESKYKNLMEFTTQEEDLLVRPFNRSIGQIANVYVDGSAYVTILTGYEYNKNKVKLTFGTFRLELTKQLNKIWR